MDEKELCEDIERRLTRIAELPDGTLRLRMVRVQLHALEVATDPSRLMPRELFEAAEARIATTPQQPHTTNIEDQLAPIWASITDEQLAALERECGPELAGALRAARDHRESIRAIDAIAALDEAALEALMHIATPAQQMALEGLFRALERTMG